MCKNIRFQRKNYIVFEAKGGYVIYNKAKSFEYAHTHIQSLSTAISIVKNIISRTPPKTTSIRLLESYLRVSSDKEYNKIIREKIDLLRVQEYYAKHPVEDVEIYKGEG